MELSGKTSDRIRAGKIPADSINPPRSLEPRPSADAVQHGEGHGLGAGSARDGTEK